MAQPNFSMLVNHMSSLLHSVECARLRYICEFGHTRPEAEVPNEEIPLVREKKEAWPVGDHA